MEQFDLVDARDNVVGVADRGQAHQRGDLHRVAAVFVFDAGGEVFVQVHARDGKWDHAVGGHVTAGESYAQAARRELAEELGLFVSVQQIVVGAAGPEYVNERHLYGLFMAVAPHGWVFKPNAEVTEVIKMPLAAVLAAMRDEPEAKFTRGFRVTMGAYLRSDHGLALFGERERNKWLKAISLPVAAGQERR